MSPERNCGGAAAAAAIASADRSLAAVIDRLCQAGGAALFRKQSSPPPPPFCRPVLPMAAADSQRWPVGKREKTDSQVTSGLLWQIASGKKRVRTVSCWFSGSRVARRGAAWPCSFVQFSKRVLRFFCSFEGGPGSLLNSADVQRSRRLV